VKKRRLKKVKRKLASRSKKRRVKRMIKINLVSAVWREGRQYVAQCLNIDVSSFGKTKTAALANLKEAVELYLEDVPVSRIAKIRRADIQKQAFVHVQK
jgi:predicted RNase H-like HicB family nuclease